ncbi:hypothetical protein D3C80_1762890 [compost metagenome]
MHLLDAAQHQFILADITGHRSACGNGRTFADRHWRHQLGIGTDKHAVADNGFILIGAIIVTGDGTGTNIHIVANLGVAQVA